VPKKANLPKNELNTTFFCSTSPLKDSKRLKSSKFAWRLVLTSCDIYQNPFTQEKILKFWQCRTKKKVVYTLVAKSFKILEIVCLGRKRYVKVRYVKEWLRSLDIQVTIVSILFPLIWTYLVYTQKANTVFSLSTTFTWDRRLIIWGCYRRAVTQ
jgi:hypothetical protein